VVNAASAAGALLKAHELTGRPLYELSATECVSRWFRPDDSDSSGGGDPDAR
jgi:hypothetical protein